MGCEYSFILNCITGKGNTHEQGLLKSPETEHSTKNVWQDKLNGKTEISIPEWSQT